MNDPLPSPAALLALLRARRSVRRFRPDPVSEDAVAALVEAAAAAPSAGNRQAWRLLLVASRERIDAMAEAVRAEVARLRAGVREDAAPEADAYLENFLHFSGAPLVVAPIHRRGPDLLQAAGAAPHAPRGDAEALASVAAAIENLLLCAHALGLGACWMTGPLVAEEALGRILEVPRGWALSALVPVGAPAEHPAPPPRRPVESLVRRL
ncbi:MAG TPA: nitroreductase family protein [Anaeromyxobacter sp.]|nr:nitroreductase family protein [Anaeromyxobacter sp.]